MKSLIEQISTAGTYNERILLKCHIGRAVRIKESCNIKAQWGHVIGFSLNSLGETILLIRTELRTEQAIHPANVEIG